MTRFKARFIASSLIIGLVIVMVGALIFDERIFAVVAVPVLIFAFIWIRDMTAMMFMGIEEEEYYDKKSK